MTKITAFIGELLNHRGSVDLFMSCLRTLEKDRGSRVSISSIGIGSEKWPLLNYTINKVMSASLRYT